MSDYTYEFKDTSHSLETFEWDQTWHEHTEDTETPRVLYIGDSISHATRKVLNSLAGGRLLFDGFASSKSLDNPYFEDSIALFAKQQPHRQLILFNNGLHGFHLADETDYATYYERMIRFLRSSFPTVRLTLLLTTHVSDPDRDLRVQARNAVVLRLAKTYDLPVIDLDSVTREHSDLIGGDGVHWSPEGYELLAKTILENL